MVFFKNVFPLLAASILVVGCAAQKQTTNSVPSFKYDFGGKTATGFTQVSPNYLYNEDAGFGYEKGAVVNQQSNKASAAISDGYTTSKTPFYFSVKLPEGTYNVKVTLGDKDGTSDAAIRAECRRMMVNRIQTKVGEIATVEFTLHIRDSFINNTTTKVRLKPRELNYFHWDNKLTLEFNGSSPKVDAIEITPAENVTTVFLAGNSTEVDQAEEPYSAWGQMLPSFFKPKKVAIANYAESGESLSSFIGERRLAKILSLMKPGDYAFVQFGHNDQKQRGTGVGAFTSFKKDLSFFISEVRKKGGLPVLVTSMQRRSFDSMGKIMETLGDYPEAVRQTATELGIPLIDLNKESKKMYEAWGPQESIKAFVHFPANTFPGQKTELKDDTHFTPFGAYEIAKIIVNGIRNNKLEIAKYIKAGVPVFDPAHPDAFASFYWPKSPSTASVKPDGN
jgi:lysophospholipase L1-like esterase